MPISSFHPQPPPTFVCVKSLVLQFFAILWYLDYNPLQLTPSPSACDRGLANRSKISGGVVKRDDANLTVPSSWRKPVVTQTPNEKLDIAGRGLTKLLPALNSTTGLMNSYPFPSSTTGEIYNQMLLYDLFTNGNQYRNPVVNGLKTVAKTFPQFNNPYLNLALQMGVAAVRASTLYGDNELLSLAEANWAYGAPIP